MARGCPRIHTTRITSSDLRACARGGNSFRNTRARARPPAQSLSNRAVRGLQSDLGAVHPHLEAFRSRPDGFSAGPSLSETFRTTRPRVRPYPTHISAISVFHSPKPLIAKGSPIACIFIRRLHISVVVRHKPSCHITCVAPDSLICRRLALYISEGFK